MTVDTKDLNIGSQLIIACVGKWENIFVYYKSSYIQHYL